ncbi:hypothetical protein [Halarcobacter anaerophilus]|uniref:hypothetical protein n=1 Tax=Halarcobacter anaerophilus TaxID=877500 RepID=UPI0005C9986C|nr:hypothetical protein [Halarcobacter anaerophilus]
MKLIENIYTKEEILQILREPKTYNSGKLEDSDIDRRMKLKPNNPQFYTLKLDIDGDYKVILQHNNDDEFPEYSAILMKNNIRICRLDFHEAHRRNCKKEIFKERVANELHLHLYCEDCLKDGFKYDAFVLNISEEKLINLDFKCFVTLFCKTICLEYKLDCQRSLFS